MSSYRFTFPNSNLTEDQKEFYEKNGYILIKNNVSDKLLNTVCQRFIDICEGKAKHSNVQTIMKDISLKNKGVQGQYLINKVQDFLYDEVLWQYCSSPAVVNVVEGIIGPNITAMHSMFINKPPNADPLASLHPLHQDLHYFPFRPPHKIVASWTAVERVDEKTVVYMLCQEHMREHFTNTNILSNRGVTYDVSSLDVYVMVSYIGIVCVNFKQSTVAELYKRMGYKNAMYHGVQGFDHLPKVHVVMDRGDTVFFHPLLLHGSGPNLTKGFRKAISCHYADSNCYFIDVRGTSQENIAAEAEGMLNKKGISLNYADAWKFKSRLVKGARGTFQSLSHL